MITIESDVLVIGTGGAGCRAALEARKHVGKVLLVAKGPISRSELTIMTMPGMDAILPGDDEDNIRKFFEDTMIGGSYLNDEDMVEKLTRETTEAAMFLEGLGARFDRRPDGTIKQEIAQSEKRTSRTLLGIDDNMGRTFYNVLMGELARRQVFLKEDTFVVDLLTTGKGVIGAFGIDLRKGEPVVFLSPAVVLATGGAGGLYSIRSTHPRDTGDGFAMAYRAGAEIIDMEFIQSHPATLVYPESARGVVAPGYWHFMGRGLKYRNKDREPFLDRYDPVRKEQATRDLKARAMHTEILEGRASQHGGIYLDFRDVNVEGISVEELLERDNPRMMNYAKLCGFRSDRMLKEGIEVGPAAHFTCGGVRIDTECRTSLPGLFAAGEVTGGVHGANRLSGNAMADIFVFGRVAGKSASSFAQSNSPVCLNRARGVSTMIREKEKAVLSILGRPSVEGLTPAVLRRKVEETMFRYVGFGREEKGLKKGLAILEEIRTDQLPMVSSSDRQKIFNWDWIQTLELNNMVDTGKIIASCALNRRESRGCQNRIDFPNRDDKNWQKHTLVKREGERISISTCPRRLKLPTQEK